MKKILLTISLCALFAASGCQQAATDAATNGSANSANASSANANSTNTANTARANATPEIDPNLQATFPFKDFPAVETTAKAGEVVLVPSYNWLQEANVKGADKTSMIWYQQKMSAPDKEMSEVEFLMGEKKKVPNAYIVASPADGKAKKGDIVLTWWQSGSGMERAIVVDDAKE